MIIQCPSCTTKFAIDATTVDELEAPRFHCSRCDNIFNLEDAPPSLRQIDDAKSSFNPDTFSDSQKSSSDLSSSKSSAHESTPGDRSATSVRQLPLPTRALQIPAPLATGLPVRPPHEEFDDHVGEVSLGRPSSLDSHSRESSTGQSSFSGFYSESSVSEDVDADQHESTYWGSDYVSGISTDPSETVELPSSFTPLTPSRANSMSSTSDVAPGANTFSGSSNASGGYVPGRSVLGGPSSHSDSDAVASRERTLIHDLTKALTKAPTKALTKACSQIAAWLAAIVSAPFALARPFKRGERESRDRLPSQISSGLTAHTTINSRLETHPFPHASTYSSGPYASEIRSPSESLGWSGMTLLVIPVCASFAVLGFLTALPWMAPSTSIELTRRLFPAAPQVAPPGLFIKGAKFRVVTLESGEKAILISGELLNDSSSDIREITVEGVLFDASGKPLATTKANATSPLARGRIRALTPELIRNTQNFGSSDPALRSGDSAEFALVMMRDDGTLLDTQTLERSRNFSARVFSVKY